ncbi:hypothetical protein [Luteibacter sp. 329MFSha]|uniref:hypothetical protein n=1 Tax=Luteibacter sp. 329MFSha TaxID=1798239 RepID=UPI0008C40ADF|nr:hypothetical protein [Luteibacter sp. 329MFSha]SEV91740.1 hypothetical protein SAMN04515660_0948 [Luteibacter sp. 329MFSha]
MPLRRRIVRIRSAVRAIGFRTRLGASASLPELLARLGRHYAAEARARDMRLELEVDPALAPDLEGDFGPLGNALRLLLDRALERRTWRVALHVDVVGDGSGSQILHFTVADEQTSPVPDDRRLREASAQVAALGGIVHTETGDDIGHRAIVELGFDLPRASPHIDVEALRTTLGGDAALREVIVALDHALTRDLADLDALLSRPGADELQAWLHRVSGALGMAEASDLARTGLTLERDLERGRQPNLDRAIRRFAGDAAEVLSMLREHAGPIGYSPGP